MQNQLSITYFISEWIISASGSISDAMRPSTPNTNFLHHTNMSAIPVEAKVVLALEALKKDPVREHGKHEAMLP